MRASMHGTPYSFRSTKHFPWASPLFTLKLICNWHEPMSGTYALDEANRRPEWPWCAGFVSFVLQQASAAHAESMPVRASFSCDLLATDAQRRSLFLAERETVPGNLPPGSVFLSRRVGGDWVHTGIVLASGPETFETIEGNTNDAGDREGYEVCRRVRGYRSKDFIVFA